MFTLQSGKQHAVAFRTAGDGAVFEEGDQTAPLTTQTDPSAHVVAIRTAQTSANGHGVAEGVAHTLDGAQGQAVAFKKRGGFGWSESVEVSPTLESEGGKHRGGPERVPLVGGMAVRRLTPRECERLQGLPDDHTLIPYNGKPAADGPRYKAIGNGMAVPVVGWIGMRIKQVDKL